MWPPAHNAGTPAQLSGSVVCDLEVGGSPQGFRLVVVVLSNYWGEKRLGLVVGTRNGWVTQIFVAGGFSLSGHHH